MNKIPNWYCSTKGLTGEQIDEMLIFAVEHGAIKCELASNLKEDYKYFGVDCYWDTVLHDDVDSFGSNATHLTYDQIKPFILGELNQDKPITDTDRLDWLIEKLSFNEITRNYIDKQIKKERE